MKTFHRILIFAYTMLIVSVANAQPPGIDDSIMSIVGKWTKGDDVYSATELTKSQIPLVLKKVDSFSKFIRAAYPTPTGAEAKWYSSIHGFPLFKGAPSPYALWSIYLYYYYNKAYRKIMLTGETGTWAYVFVNHPNWLFGDSRLTLTIDGKTRTAWLFPADKGQWKGYTLYAPYTHGGNNASAIVITKNGKVPWKPISQLQYLTGFRKITEQDKQQALEGVDKSIDSAQRYIDNLKKNTQLPAASRDNMVKSLEKVRDDMISKRESRRQQITAHYDKDLKVIDDYLGNTDAATLAGQAVLTNWRIFKGKFHDVKDKGAYRMVYIDESYFNPDIPSHIPQMMVLYWRWNDNAPGRYFRKQIEENFPIEQLRAMLR